MNPFGADISNFDVVVPRQLTLNGEVPVADVGRYKVSIERIERQDAAVERGITQWIETGKRRRSRIDWELISRRQIRKRARQRCARSAESIRGQLEKWLAGDELKERLSRGSYVINAVSCTNGSLAISLRIPSQADARSKVVRAVAQQSGWGHSGRALNGTEAGAGRQDEPVQDTRACVFASLGIQQVGIEVTYAVLGVRQRANVVVA